MEQSQEENVSSVRANCETRRIETAGSRQKRLRNLFTRLRNLPKAEDVPHADYQRNVSREMNCTSTDLFERLDSRRSWDMLTPTMETGTARNFHATRYFCEATPPIGDSPKLELPHFPVSDFNAK